MTYQPPPAHQPPPAVPGQPLSPPAGYGYPPAAEPRKKRRWPWIVGGLVLLSVLGCVGFFTLIVGGTTAAVKGLDDNQKGKNAATGAMNKPTKDGKFEFTVTGMKCGLDKVGSDLVGQPAQGQFCLVDVRVKNIATSAEIFNDSSQKGYDAAGTEYSVDSGAGVYANKEYSTFLEQINPGNTVRGKLAFDVPADAKLTSVVLHESMFTEGVKVPLK
jgi:Domain of unknown function (DUF4352)